MTKRTADRPAQSAAAPAERVIARLHPHARRLFWPCVLLIAVSGATGYFAGTFPETWQNTALLIVAGLIVFLFCLLPLLFWLSTRYTITTRRVILRRGFFVRVKQEVLHSRGYDVSVRSGWLQAMSRSGDVLIDTGQGHPIVLADVPSASLVQQTLHDLIEDAQRSSDAPDASGSGPITS
ncbi:hypothetical protein GCM10022381_16720 [Leifsonia kafniensis]|uniref:YdbS-like PH domain-containing protein n=1 Tax=Leifsonia kafniensis TaxID=475957 RepID=A0ABP7KE52_9MICO